MQIDVYTKDGSQNGQVELSDEVFAIEPNEHAMHLDVVTFLAHQRQGTAKTKTRAEVRGGGRKPWRQKGRGTARAGSTRSPLWVGGGTIHGPKPRDYNQKLPRKVRRLARKSALSVRIQEKSIMIVEDFSFDQIRTKSMIEVFSKLQLTNEKTLVLIPDVDNKVYMSSRNIPGVSINLADKISTYDILNHKRILIFKGAIEKIENTFK
jgi:large subunit ribosomal protein L4